MKDHPIDTGLKNTRVLRGHSGATQRRKSGIQTLEPSTELGACTPLILAPEAEEAGGSRGRIASWSPPWTPGETVSKTEGGREGEISVEKYPAPHRKESPAKAKTKENSLRLPRPSLLGVNRRKGNPSSPRLSPDV